MTNFYFAVVDDAGNYLERGLEYHHAARVLLEVDGNSFRFATRPGELWELEWGKWGEWQPTGIQARSQWDIFWQVINRDEPWGGRYAVMEDLEGDEWWCIAQPGRPAFFGYGSEGEAHSFCGYLNGGNREDKGGAFEVRKPTAGDKFHGGYGYGSGNAKLADALRECRSVFAIDNQVPVILRDLTYPDRLFELTSKIFVHLNWEESDDLHSDTGYLRIRIDENYIRWCKADWRAAIESALRSGSEPSDIQCGHRNSTVSLKVSLETTSGPDILLYRCVGGVVDQDLDFELDRLRGEIYHKIASVPDSGRTDCLRQAALSNDGSLEIKCKRRGLALLSRSQLSQR